MEIPIPAGLVVITQLAEQLDRGTLAWRWCCGSSRAGGGRGGPGAVAPRGAGGGGDPSA